MLASVTSMGLSGIDGFLVSVETYCVNGMPMFELVGLPDAAVKESRERVRAAMASCDLFMPVARLTINLAPADVKKEGPAYDLPIALSILAADGKIDGEALEGVAVVGELSLFGKVVGVRGALSMAIAAKERGMKAIMLPAENAQEAACVEGLQVLAVSSLQEAVEHLRGRKTIAPEETRPYAQLIRERKTVSDFADVRGQRSAKRALEIAAAGGHNVLMIGPPGSGKTMMARCLPGILPDMTLEEALEVTRIHSAAGELAAGSGLMLERPFRAPHHTVSAVALVGGGSKARPGEISLAHQGVLFLDELPEYDRPALEAMRQPLEDGFVSVVRIAAQARYPARTMLIAAMNPCPCGNYGSKTQPCRCSQKEIARYLGRISGPLLDRIDMQLEVAAVPVKEITAAQTEESSAAIRERVQKARKRQQERYAETGVGCNAELSARQVTTVCALDDACQAIIERACERYNLSMRAVSRIMKVARTISDLAGEENIGKAHVLEALAYRNLDGSYWK
ncbi:MAG: YifB family Mg chelatase-like AAA ATPase [Clostridia bacterium]|nr:YifB family Mg chelatase-like AAA ATPase [Clostridia bacterium]